MFVSISFLMILGGIIVAFLLLPKKWRPAVLLSGSFLFCVQIEPRALIVLLAVSFLAWITGIAAEKAKASGRAKAAVAGVAVMVCLFLLLLCTYKYSPSLLMPVGLSFYLFQAVGYLVDIYQGKDKAERNPVNLCLYFAFFPKLVSGPIERGKDFLPQLKQISHMKFWDRGRLSAAFTYMLWGYFMKMVVADRLALITNYLFSDPAAYDSFWLFWGVFFYTIQIYCDFAGYSYIAIGCARIFGIRLIHNFEMPYMAESISDFWHRWHISLSTWLRDYVYIPLGGNRKGIKRKCINTMIVFLLCGLWHGTGLQFIVWGMLHGCYLILETVKIKGGRGLTFLAVAFAWVFFRADSLEMALTYYAQLFTAGIHPARWQQMVQAMQLNGVEIALSVIGILVIFAVEGVCYQKKMHLPVLIQHKKNAVRYLVFYLLILAIFIFGMYGPGFHTEQFIYMQF